jgi:TolB-like protein
MAKQDELSRIELSDLLNNGGNAADIEAMLVKLEPSDLLHAVFTLKPNEQRALLSIVSPNRAATLIEELPDGHAANLIEEMAVEDSAPIVLELASDHRADVLSELDEAEAEAIIAKLDEEDALEVRELISYAPDQAGGLMMGDGTATVPLGKTVAAMLVTEFSGRPGMQVIERAQLNEMLREQDLALYGRVDESSAVAIGKMLGAQYVLTGQATDIAGNLRMDIRAVDVETSEILAVLKMSGLTTALFSIIVDLADDFGEMLDLTPPSGRAAVESIPVPATIGTRGESRTCQLHRGRLFRSNGNAAGARPGDRSCRISHRPRQGRARESNRR